MTLVDTNVLVDILSDDPNWRIWSVDRLEERSSQGPLLINDVIYAELSSRYSTEELLDGKILELNVALQRMPKRALFIAGHAFEQYRRAGGTRSGVLPDFFILMPKSRNCRCSPAMFGATGHIFPTWSWSRRKGELSDRGGQVTTEITA